MSVPDGGLNNTAAVLHSLAPAAWSEAVAPAHGWDLAFAYAVSLLSWLHLLLPLGSMLCAALIVTAGMPWYVSNIFYSSASALYCRRPRARESPVGANRNGLCPLRYAGVWLCVCFMEVAYVLLAPVLLPIYICSRLYDYLRDMRTIFRLNAQVRRTRPQGCTAVMNLHAWYSKGPPGKPHMAANDGGC